MADLTQDNISQIRTIVREETDDIRADVDALKTDVTTLKTDVSAIKSDMVEIKSDMIKMKFEINRTVTLQEDMNDKLDKALESLSDNLTVKKKVDSHEERIAHLESDNNLSKEVIALHSRQLRDMGA